MVVPGTRSGEDHARSQQWDGYENGMARVPGDVGGSSLTGDSTWESTRMRKHSMEAWRGDADEDTERSITFAHPSVL